MNPPQPKRDPHVHRLHNDERIDDYFWLRYRENPDVIHYLEEENAYCDSALKPIETLTQKLFQEMVALIPEEEEKVPVKDGAYYYYSRMAKGLQYEVYARKRANHRGELADAQEEIILDLNTLATDGGYLSVTTVSMSPDHSRVAYLENRDGSDKYTVFVKDVNSDVLLGDRIENVFIHDSLEWDGTGDSLYYVTVDESQRPFQLWRHKIGVSDVGFGLELGRGQDVLLYEEEDVTFSLRLSKSRSGRFLFLTSENKTTSEVRYLDLSDEQGTFQVMDVRRLGVQYELEHWGDEFLILTNDGATNFKLMRCPITSTMESARKALIPYDETCYFQAVYPFRHALVIFGRQDGLTQLWVYREGELTRLIWDDPVYTVSAVGNRSYDTTEVLVQFESLLTPKTTIAIDFERGTRDVLKEPEFPGSFDPSDYCQERLWATADDGTQVPYIAVYRKDARNLGPSPLILYGYGSYGSNSDPRFDSSRIPILDQGIIYAIAQIRGGSEMGHSWYEDGKLLKKRNTFTDFIAVAKDVIARDYTSPSQLAARGGSAGGLLLGAVANMAGYLFKVMTPAVPFVDVVTTMLDATIPLTSLEWDEWGNPEDEAYYTYMKSYSPYDNVEKKDYPHMLVTTGLNDPRVAYWEPAKWVARLRSLKTDANVLLLKTNMGAGHFGSSGRFNHLKELAQSYAFILDKLGITME